MLFLLRHSTFCTSLLLFSSLAWARTTETLFLSDLPERFLETKQDWGRLGWDVAAHAAGQEPMPLRIGDKTYAKGLGHHANGRVVVMLDGRFERFEADVGIQKQAGDAGSVVFRVFVDGEKRFDSGVVRQADGSKRVEVSVRGAQELCLEVHDAGDGITCDMANWAETRLVPAATDQIPQPKPAVDVAPFARVVTWDPSRLDGARALRTEEYRAEDVFLETGVAAQPDGTFVVPTTSGSACIGLQWLNRRAVRELAVEFAPDSPLPAPNTVQVQGWFGESAWQGRWQPLAGTMKADGQRLTFAVAPRTDKGAWVQTRKVRWILPGVEKPIVVRRLSAFTRSRWDVAPLWIEADAAAGTARGEVRIVNGEILDTPSVRWAMAEPLRLAVRYSRPSTFQSDPTVLQFRLPSGAVGVAVEDVLERGCVYLPDHGLFVTIDPPPIGLAAYKKRIAGRKTILAQVREMPDQTLEQAMAKTHHDAQREGPVMLSLAADNAKFVVDREGDVHFQPQVSPGNDWFATAAAVKPSFGAGQGTGFARRLDGGWLPVPVIAVQEEGVQYIQRTFVAPLDATGKRSVCVSEFSVANTASSTAPARLALTFLANERQNKPAQLRERPHGFLVVDQDKTLALVDTRDAAPLAMNAAQGTVTFDGIVAGDSTAGCVVYLAAAPMTAREFDALPPAASLRAETERYWTAMLAPAMQIGTPEPLLNHLIRSSQVRCWIAARQEAEGARLAPWIAAMSYGPLESEAHSVIRGMDYLGHADFARRGLDFFIHRYNDAGFLTTGYTTFGMAWHLWTLAEHQQLHPDADWWRRAAPELARVGRWIIRQTEKTKRSDALGRPAPEYGLMPPGVLADWNAFAYHFCLNAYYYAALRGLGDTLRDAGHPDAELFSQRAEELRANILRAYRWTQAQSPALPLRDGTWIPAYPSQVHSPGRLVDFFPGDDAGRSGAYDVELGAHQMAPTGVWDADSSEVARMMEHMEDVQFLGDGWFDYPAAANERDWFNLGGFAKCQPYYARNAEIYALRDDVKPFVRSYFNMLASLLNPEVLTFWEHFNHTGAWDKTHETGYFLHQTRLMFVMERGDELWLAPLIPSQWLEDGKEVKVSRAPTWFGEVGYRIVSRVADGFVETTIEPPTRRPPKALVLRLRHPTGKPLRAVTVDGQDHTDFSPATDCIRLRASDTPIRVRAEY